MTATDSKAGDLQVQQKSLDERVVDDMRPRILSRVQRSSSDHSRFSKRDEADSFMELKMMILERKKDRERE